MKPLFALLILSAISGCMEMDSFLFNTEPLDHYSPRFVPDSLLEPVMLTSDGLKLYGFWVRSDGRRPGLTILYCHGNKHHLDEYWERVEFLRQLGGNVFVFDYRGFGMSEGASSEHGLQSDAEAALNYVKSRGVDQDSLVFYGYSLGSIAAIHLAGNVESPYRLIVESGIASATSLVQGASVLDFPARWLTDGTFDNGAIIRRVDAPMLFLHGTADDFVRYRDNGLVLFQNAGTATGKPIMKVLEEVPGADHVTVPQTMGVQRYLGVVEDFIGG